MQQLSLNLHHWRHFPDDDNGDAVSSCVCDVCTHLLQEEKHKQT